MAPAVRAGGTIYPLTLSTSEAGRILGISEEACRRRCVKGVLPLLPRYGKETWRIPTGKLFAELGLEYETVTAAVAS
jgi:hypothetical protein